MRAGLSARDYREDGIGVVIGSPHRGHLIYGHVSLGFDRPIEAWVLYYDTLKG